MAISDWSFEFTFSPGTLVRSDTFNQILEGIDSWSTEVANILNDNVLKVPGTVTLTTTEFPEANYTNSILYINSENSLDYLNLTAFDASVADVIQKHNHISLMYSELRGDEYINNLIANRAVNFEQTKKQNMRIHGASGFVYDGKHYNPSIVKNVNDGISCEATTPYEFTLGRTTSQAYGSSKTDHPVVNIGGVVFDLAMFETYYSNKIKTPLRPDGLDMLDKSGRFDDLPAAIVAGGNTLSASSIDRQTIVAARSKTSVITDKVYPRGMMQYQETSYLGVPTIVNPDQSECAMYSDNWSVDTETVGRIFDWPNLTDEQKDIVINGHPNIHPNDAGVLVQEVVQLFNYQTSVNYARTTPIATVMNSEGFTAVAGDSGLYTKDGWNVIPVIVVDMMNQGAHDLEFNENGCREWLNPNVALGMWYEDPLFSQNMADSFTPAGTVSGEVGYRPTGNISSGSSGHFTGRYFDAVYQDQVWDIRAKLSPSTPIVSLEKAVRAAIGGKASSRAVEFVPFTSVETLNADTTTSYLIFDTATPFMLNIQVGSQIYDINGVSVGYVVDVSLVGSISGKPQIRVGNQDGTVTGNHGLASGDKVLIGTHSNIPSAYTIDILLSDPQEFLDMFPNGCFGRVIPDFSGTTKTYPLNSKALSNGNYIYSVDGTTWAAGVEPINTTTNMSSNWNTGGIKVVLLQYKLAPDFTVSSGLARIDYINGLFYSLNHNSVSYGCGLVSSLIGKVATGTQDQEPTVTQPLLSYGIDYPNGELYPNALSRPTHAPLKLDNVDSPAVKCIIYPHIPDTGLVEYYVIYEQLINDSSADSGADFTDITEVSAVSLTAGVLYHITDGQFEGYWRCIATSGVGLTNANWYEDTSGNIKYSESGSNIYLTRWNGSGFGDNQKFIISGGTAYTEDANGNIKQYGCAQLFTGENQYLSPSYQVN